MKKISKYAIQSLLCFLFAVTFPAILSACQAWAASGSDVPMVRGPGVSEEQLQAFSESQARVTLSDALDAARPGSLPDEKLKLLVERAQAAWLSGSSDAARPLFRDITKLALEADWKEPQREAIQYAYLRLAQLAPSMGEKHLWLERAVTTFPDLPIDDSLFPPPLTDIFRAVRTQILSEAKPYDPAVHFPDHQLLLINGKRFTLNPELKIRLPQGRFRITALSDTHAPLTELLSRTQLDEFRAVLPALAGGNCDQPTATSDDGSKISTFAVVYSSDCVRVKTGSGWLGKNTSVFSASATDLPSEESLKSARAFLRDKDLVDPNASSAPKVKSKTWLWVGLGALAAGSAYVMAQEFAHHRQSGSTTSAAPPPSPAAVPAPAVQPQHHEGF